MPECYEKFVELKKQVDNKVFVYDDKQPWENFVELKKQMDNKVFVYDDKQPWEKDIEKCINNNTFVQFINNFIFQTK